MTNLWVMIDQGTAVMNVPGGMIIRTFQFETDREVITVVGEITRTVGSADGPAEAMVLVPCSEAEVHAFVSHRAEAYNKALRQVLADQAAAAEA